MIAVRDHFISTQVTLVVVTFSAIEQLAAYRRLLALACAVLSDPDRNTYRDYQLPRGRVRDVYGMGTMRMYASLLRKGRKLRRPAGDTLQLGGDFVIDGSGLIVAAFYPKGPDDRPTVDQLALALGMNE